MQIPNDFIRHFAIQAEIEAQSDRGTALVATSYLDERLREALRAALSDAIEEAKDGSDTVEARLFDGTGPFATLSGKINVAFALGFLGTVALRDLHLIRKIRNHFAHSADPGRFDMPPVSDWCRELRLPDWCLLPGESSPPTEARARFLTAMHLAWSFLWTEMCKKGLVGEGRVAPNPTTLI
jgi:DNA-binding MltR family transcriptional regulator